METPMSTRRVTRSQTLASANKNNSNVAISRKMEESDMGLTKSRTRNGKKQQQQQQKQDRSALIDITNDSPIVGLAMGGDLAETPASLMAKQRSNRVKLTPGSGEDLLRGQVKTLLQKVEEEAAEVSKFSSEQKGGPLLHLKGLVCSPMGLLAPTPANTPSVLNLSADQCIRNNGNVGPAPIIICPPVTASTLPVIEEQLNISQMVDEIVDGKTKECGGYESQRSEITRSLLLDFSEKSEISADSSECSSVVSYQEMGGENSEGRSSKSFTDDDNASVWSIQVNASVRDEDEEEEEEEEEGIGQGDEDYEYYDEIAVYGGGEEGEEDSMDLGSIDELCDGMNKMSVDERRKETKFCGKHTRFVYNSDDEIEGEEEAEREAEALDSPPQGFLRLNGLPTPKGKHFHFPEEEEEEEGQIEVAMDD